MAVAPEGNLCQSREPQWNGVRAVKGVINKGKYFYEATVSDEGLCRVGWSLNEVRFLLSCLRLIPLTMFSLLQASLDLGTDRWGFGFGGTGKKSNNKQFDDYGSPFGLSDVIGCGLDLDSNQISFWKNGQHLGVAFQIPPEFTNKAFFPALVLKVAFKY